MSHVARIASLTKRLAQTSITSSSSLGWKGATTAASAASSIGLLHNSTFASSSSSSSLLMSTARCMSSKKSKDDTVASSNTQHEEWVKFQQSIAVDGFNTGQTTKVTTSGLTGRKHRGGKQMRKRKEKELELQKRDDEFASMGGSQFPTLRYSDEETERLLHEAYSSIPPRAGPRRSRHLKRERIRWWRVRKIRKTLKKQKIAAHFRRMAERSRIVKEVLSVKAGAEVVRGVEGEYRDEVLRRWVLDNLLVEGGEGVGKKKMMIQGGGGSGVEEVDGNVEEASLNEAGLANEKGERKN